MRIQVSKQWICNVSETAKSTKVKLSEKVDWDVDLNQNALSTDASAKSGTACLTRSKNTMCNQIVKRVYFKYLRND